MRVARWGVGVVLMVAACGEPEVGREVVPMSEDAAVAVVAAVKGKVEVRDAAGKTRTAEYDTRLRLSDTLITAPDAVAVVLLANNYVLKIPDDQETPVRKFQHLGDPPATKSVQEMFRDELGDGYSGLVDGEKLERIAGWNQLQAAGETPAPEVGSAPLSAEPVLTPEPGQIGASGHAGATAPSPAEPAKPLTTGQGDSPTLDKRPENKRDESKDDSPKKDNKKGEAKKTRPTDPPVPEPKTEEELNSGDVPMPNAWSLVGEDGVRADKTGLPALLRDRWAALSQCGGAANELRVKVIDGKVASVTPAACGTLLTGKALPEAGGSATVVVRLR